MGLLDDAKATISRGTAAAERTAKTLTLKNRIDGLQKQRRDLVAQIGASLYEVTKDIEEFREGRESIYEAIYKCDKEKNECQSRIDELEAESRAASLVECHKCGDKVSSSDAFCWSCGSPVDKDINNSVESKISPEDATVFRCEKCSSPVADDDAFCMKCGAKLIVRNL